MSQVHIEKEAKKRDTMMYPRIYTSSARAAFYHILSSLKKEGGADILLPSYIGLSKIEGSGVFDPVKKAGVGFDFYQVNQRLVPSLDDIEAKLKTGKYRLVFLIHYFGIPQIDPKTFVELCHKYDAYVIEDCAHSIVGGRGTSPLGESGDFVLFSIHKLTNTIDGGFYYDPKRLLKNSTLADDLKISMSTLMQFSCLNLHAANERRFENYHRVAAIVRDYPDLELMYTEVSENCVPLNCPVIVKRRLRETLYFKMKEKGILTTALYHTLIPEITQERFPDSLFVAKNILNLPTHQDVTIKEIEYFKNTLKSVMNEIGNNRST